MRIYNINNGYGQANRMLVVGKKYIKIYTTNNGIQYCNVVDMLPKFGKKFIIFEREITKEDKNLIEDLKQYKDKWLDCRDFNLLINKYELDNYYHYC